MRLFILISLCVILCFPGFSQLTIEEKEDGILVQEKGDSVLFYQSGPKSINGRYERTNYIHPLWNVDGMILTEDFPSDHFHQRGVFWAWHQILIDGESLGDGWELKNYKQEVVHSKGRQNVDGTVSLINTVNWESDLYRPEGKFIPYLQEDNEIVVYPVEKNFRRIDFIIKLTALGLPVSIGGSEDEKGYSGFSIRMKLPDDVIFKGLNGVLEPQNTSISAKDYVDVSGTLDGTSSGGVVIIDHSSNPGYPQEWILRKSKSMQNVKYPGRNPVTILSQKPLTLSYSLILYKENISTNKIQEIVNEVNVKN